MQPIPLDVPRVSLPEFPYKHHVDSQTDLLLNQQHLSNQFDPTHTHIERLECVGERLTVGRPAIERIHQIICSSYRLMDVARARLTARQAAKTTIARCGWETLSDGSNR